MRWNWKKTAIAGVTAAVLTMGGVAWYQWGHTSSEPVYVYPFEFVGMTEYWGDSRESYGPVSTDRIQTVFLSETQSVKEMLVQQGDSVKKGDVLMTFDTTLDALAVEKKRLEMERNKLQLEDAEDELRRIMGLKPSNPVDPTDPTDPTEPDTGEPWTEDQKITKDSTHNGLSQTTPAVIWLNSMNTEFNYSLFEEIAQRLTEHGSKPHTESEQLYSEENEENEQQESSDSEGYEHDYNPDPEPEPEKMYTEWEVRQILENLLREYEEMYYTEEQVQEIIDKLPAPFRHDLYLVIKVTADNKSKGTKLMWQGIRVYHGARDQMQFHFFDASTVPDPAMTEVEKKEEEYYPNCHHKHRHKWNCELLDTGEETEVIDYGSGFTAAELAKMRAEQERKIKELRLKVKLSEADYKIMAKELGDGNIYAETDGTILSVLDEEEAKSNQQPILKVSDGGGFYVEGSVSELERDNLNVGQEVTINSWDTGMSYTGSVTEVREFPNSNGDRGFGNGNPNATQYPFVAFVDGTADLREGNYVSISYSAAGNQNGVYLQMPFVRTEQGRSFVYVLGENGRLEQRTVVTGKTLWGSYVEILDGVSLEDQIAFPYGKNVKPGVKAMVGDLSNLYS